jgi:hypothetical protein
MPTGLAAKDLGVASIPQREATAYGPAHLPLTQGSPMSTSPRTPDRPTAHARIAVAVWQPEPYDQPADGPALVRIHVEESFTGDISASGVATFLQALQPDGSGSFCGLERVTGAIDGRAGTFVLEDAGTLTSEGSVSGTWFVVPGSGTGELAGLRGEGGFSAALGQNADVELTYWFE